MVRSPVRPAAALLVALAVATGIAACGGASSPAGPAGGASPAAAGSGTPDSLPSTLEITAQDMAFTPTAIDAPAGAALTITFRNRDDGIPHGIAVRAGQPREGVAPPGEDLFSGPLVTGPATITYTLPALPPGAYTFFCPIHPNMIGTLTLR